MHMHKVILLIAYLQVLCLGKDLYKYIVYKGKYSLPKYFEAELHL